MDEFDEVIKEFKAKGLRLMAEAETEEFKVYLFIPKPISACDEIHRNKGVSRMD
jgi:hypothetical protein